MALDFNKVLITGGSGMIGRYLDVGLRPSKAEFDITDTERVASFVKKMQPTAILHFAALTDMAYCEKNPKDAFRINAESTKVLAKAATAVNARFIYLSTNAVFDGTKSTPYDEADLPSPANEYGKSKLAGEAQVKEYARKWLIVRTARVFGGGKAADKRFVEKIIHQLRESEIHAIDDCLDTPTYAKDLIQTMKSLMREGRTGVVHITNSGIASRFLQAKYIADFFGYRGRLVPVSLNYFHLTPPPLYNEALVSKTTRLRPWQEALREYLETEWR